MYINDDTAVDDSPWELISLYRQLDGICQNYRAALNQTKSVAHLRLATKVSRGRRYYEARMRRQDQPRRIPLGTAENPTVQKAMEPGHSGFGLRNVDMRIRLFYQKQKGLILRSDAEGTEVSFTIPIRTREEIDHDESFSRG